MATPAVTKAYPAIITLIVGIFLGMIIDWGRMLPVNSTNITALFTAVDKQDKRIARLEQKTGDLYRIMEVRLVAIETILRDE